MISGSYATQSGRFSGSYERLNLVVTNVGAAVPDPRCDLEYTLYDADHRLVDVVNAAGNVGENGLVGAVMDVQSMSFHDDHAPGTYVLAVDVYGQEFNIIRGSVAKEIVLGPAAEAVIEPPRTPEALPLAAFVVVDDVRYEFDRVALTDDHTAIDSANLLVRNIGAQPKDLRRNLEYTLYNDQLERIDLVNMAGFVGENGLIGAFIDVQGMSFHHTQSPGTYILRVDVFAEAFNLVEGTVAKEIELGPAAADLVEPVRDPEVLTPTASVLVDGVAYTFSAVHLDATHERMDAVDLAYENTTGAQMDLRVDLKYVLYDAGGTLIDAANLGGFIGGNGLIGDAVDEQGTMFHYDQAPGTYLLRVDVYDNVFNTIRGTLVKEIELGPAAADVQ